MLVDKILKPLNKAISQLEKAEKHYELEIGLNDKTLKHVSALKASNTYEKERAERLKNKLNSLIGE